MSRTSGVGALVIAAFLVFGATASAQDGEGVAAGNLLLSPGLRLEAGFDSNALYQAAEEEPQPSGVIVVNPYLGVRTADPRMAELTANVGLAWEQFLASKSSTGGVRGPNEQSALDVDADIGVRLNPAGIVSLTPSDELTWASKPSLTLSGDPYRLLRNTFDLALALHPGGYGRSERLGLSGEAGFTHRTWRYDEVSEYDHTGMGGRLELQWNFLPRTGVFISGGVETIDYDSADTGATTVRGVEPVDNVDSLSMRGSVGFTGLLTRRLSLQLSAGYGVGNYDSGPDPRTYLAHVDFGIHASRKTTIHFGWQHNFEDVVLSSFITSHRAYVESNSTLGRVGLGLAAYAHLNDYSAPTRDGDEVDVYNGDRTDTVVGGRLDITYTARSWFTLGLRYNPSIRDSTATFSDLSGDPISADYVQHRAFFFIDLAAARPTPLAGVSGGLGSALGR